jgi:hypothetical protein
MGEYMKFEMVIDLVEVAPPDPPELPELEAESEPEPPPLLQAARSSAAPRTRTTAPPLNRLPGSRIVQTAIEVGLNASGVPDDVCAPGYIPST